MAWLSLLLMMYLFSSAKAGYYTDKCDTNQLEDGKTTTLERYDVTNNNYIIVSHDGFGSTHYPGNYRKCIDIWTNQTDHVIKLKEDAFTLEDVHSYQDACAYDHVKMFYTSLDNAEFGGAEKIFCKNDGPGTRYSSGNHMFLYFLSDSSDTEEGFKFEISSLHRDDIPIQLSVGAIVGIALGAFAVLVIIITVVTCLLIKKKRPGHVRQVPPTNQNAAMVSNTTTYNQQQMPVGYMPQPPQYQQQKPQQKPAFQTGYNTAPATQPFGQSPGQQPVNNIAYPPPSALYGSPPTQY